MWLPVNIIFLAKKGSSCLHNFSSHFFQLNKVECIEVREYTSAALHSYDETRKSTCKHSIAHALYFQCFPLLYIKKSLSQTVSTNFLNYTWLFIDAYVSLEHQDVLNTIMYRTLGCIDLQNTHICSELLDLQNTHIFRTPRFTDHLDVQNTHIFRTPWFTDHLGVQNTHSFKTLGAQNTRMYRSDTFWSKLT